MGYISHLFAVNNGAQQLWLRGLEKTSGQPLAGTDGASYPFWSPDSRSIGFFAGGKMKRIDIAGGPSQNLADSTTGRGGAWNNDGTILFSPSGTGPLYRIPASGGEAVKATRLGTQQVSHRFPQFAPDGHHFKLRPGR